MATTAPADTAEKGKAKEGKEASKDGQPEVYVYGLGLTEETVVRQHEHEQKSSCCKHCKKTILVVVAIFAVLECLAEITVTVSTAIVSKVYDPEQSGRLVGLILLALLAAVVITVLINGVVAVFRKKTKPLHAGAILLFVVAVVQAIVVGLTCKVTLQDELELAKSLQQSFQQSKDNNPFQLGTWASTQHALQCCGVYGPEDYRRPTEFFAPDVPISCCPSYDPNRSDLVQERDREVCKSKKTYYFQGCNDLVIHGFKANAKSVVWLSVALIVTEVILAISMSCLARKIKQKKDNKTQDQQATTQGPVVQKNEP